MLMCIGVVGAGLTNGDFESGDFSGWSVSHSNITISSAEKHGGSYSAKMHAYVNENASLSLQQSPTPFNVSGYSFWYKIEFVNGTEHDFEYSIRCTGISNIEGTKTDVAGWSQITGHIENNEGLYLVDFGADATSGPDGELIVYIDDVEFWYVESEFSANATEGFPPFPIQFTNASYTDVTDWYWVFGDGETSTDENPLHWYNVTIGNTITSYTVELNVTNASGYAWENKTDYIDAYPLNASFTANATTGLAPSWANIAFTDLTDNGTATSWNWSFGDGDYSEDQNPVHSYTSIGTYNVTLNASNAYSYDIEEKLDYITITAAPVPVAAFAADDTSGATPFTFTLTDATSNSPTAWNWYYNSGSGWVLFNTSQNPVRTFTPLGTYSIKLVASNMYGSDDEEKTGYITVTEEEPEEWLPGYYSRCIINITGDDSWSEPASDYPVQLYVYATSGSSSGNTLYIGDSLSNVRFTDTSNTLLTYTFVETNEVYVKIPLIQNSSADEDATQIYMYYNPLLDQSSLSTWDNGGAFLFGDNFSDASINTSRWNISVNDITYTMNPFRPTACTWMTGYDNFYDVYDQNSVASQFQANWSVPENVEIVFKSRMYTTTDSYFGTSGFGFVDPGNNVSVYLGHGQGSRLNQTWDGSCASTLYVIGTYYVSEYRYLIENTRQYMAHAGPWQNWGCGYSFWALNYFSSLDATRYFIIQKEGTDIRLLKSTTSGIYDGYLYNSTSSDISKFALITGTRNTGQFIGGPQVRQISIYYVFARDLLPTQPIANVYSCETNSEKHIEFDRSIYSISDTAIVTTSIPDVFWNTLTHTYSAHIYRSTDLATPIKSWAVSTQDQVENVDMSDLGAGTYYAYLYMHQNSPSVSYLLDSDSATSYSAFILSGYTYDGPAGTILEGTSITATVAGTPYTNTSLETGYYEFDPMSIGTAISILATKTRYTNYSESITPLAAVRVVKNISLVPDDIGEYWTFADNGTACGGFVFVAPYNATATGANVTLSNGTWSSSQIMGPEGWYFFDKLSEETYDFDATLTPYIPISSNVTTVADNFTRKDFVFGEGTYDLTVYVLDSVTGGLMTTNATITINDGAGGIESQTVSNGTALFENLYGSYTLTVSSTGYTTSTRTVLMDEDKYVAVTLSVASESGGSSTYYNPHQVKFVIQDNYGRGLADTTVTVTPTTSTLDTITNWLTTLLGLPSDTGIDTTALSGTTDTNGAVTFVMVEDIRYQVDCVNVGQGVDETYYIYPKDDAYVIIVSTTDSFSHNRTMISDGITWTFTNTTINETHELLMFNYYDPTGETTNVSFWVRTHASPLSTCHQEYCSNPNSCSATYTCSAYNGQEYYCGATCQHGYYGEFEATQIYHYQKLVDLGIDSAYYPYIAVAFLIVIAAIFSVISVKFGAVLIPIFGFMFYYMKWLPFDYRGVALLTILLVIGIFAYIRKQEDKVGS